MGYFGTVAAAAFAAWTTAGLGLSADRRRLIVSPAWRIAIANAAAETVPAHDDGAALLLSLA